MTLAFVDVDDLKRVNDHHGHPAGDALLVAVASAIRANVRSYDPVVRLGGDEFVVGLSDNDLHASRRRFADIQATLDTLHPGGSISVGFAAVQPGDTLAQLWDRGDRDLYRVKRDHRPLGMRAR